MVRPLRLEYPKAFYHIISRGNERKNIFLEDEDFKSFLDTYNYQSARCNVITYAYCLMDNHIHLLLQTIEGNLSYFMQRLLGSYTMHFNRKYKRIGHLFQGRYKSIIVDSDTYLLQLSRYIYLNPCKVKIKKKPEQYKWSSMKLYLGATGTIDNFDKELVLSRFASKNEYKKYVQEGLNIEEDILEKAVSGCILGAESFVEEIKTKLENRNKKKSRTRRIYGINIKEVKETTKNEDDQFKIYALWRWSKLKQSEIAKIFNKTDAAISYTVRQIEKNIRDKSIRAKLDYLENQLGI